MSESKHKIGEVKDNPPLFRPPLGRLWNPLARTSQTHPPGLLRSGAQRFTGGLRQLDQTGSGAICRPLKLLIPFKRLSPHLAL
ncbi:hypothetical protein SAMN02745166_02310 [Prosthecobacter debontii]|uniref:Uncharacterized protein n=1 Tax=Prosthecobacter debontii TaxID=48467 RepID=A0A1T4Y085_9BACT|nr:hypothetical protein SAMN02745166_02310 [Prosthecobacter debontii]